MYNLKIEHPHMVGNYKEFFARKVFFSLDKLTFIMPKKYVSELQAKIKRDFAECITAPLEKAETVLSEWGEGTKEKYKKSIDTMNFELVEYKKRISSQMQRISTYEKRRAELAHEKEVVETIFQFKRGYEMGIPLRSIPVMMFNEL